VRRDGLALLSQAIAHYRDCLRHDPEHEAARYNLELIRQWIKQMQDLWSARDRQQQREEMNLLQLLEMIQAEQEQLRQTARTLQDQDDSPLRRQAVSQSATGQRRLMEEIPPLKKKISETFESPSPAAPASPSKSPPAAAVPDAEKAIEVLHGLADKTRQSMQQAAGHLDDQALAEAAAAQAMALDSLNDIYVHVAPFTSLLGKATGLQQALVEAARQIVEPAASDQQAPIAEDLPPPDIEEMARSQAIVHRWSRILPKKAEQELQQLPAVPAGPPPRDKPATPPPYDPAAKGRELKPALEKAVEVGPKVEELSGEAADQLQQNQVAKTLPNQEEALRLLNEINDLLPEQPPQEKPQEQQPKQDPKDKQPKQDQANQPSPKPSPDQRKMSREQAQALMRKVRERERQRREREKQLRGYMQGGIVVDKDW
jgi:hypothetical protein